MAQQPYRFSKKAGRYIPNSQSGNRSFYHKLLASIEPNAGFDPNSTYGKHIMKKTVSELRKYRRTKQKNGVCQYSHTSQLRQLIDLKTENKREEAFRISNAINERASEIAHQKHALIGFIKKRPFLIGSAIAVFTYMTRNEFQNPFWIFLGSWLALTILSNWIFHRIKKSYLTQAENEIKNTDFSKDLRAKELNKQEEINRTKIEIEDLEKELKIIENKVRLKAQELLNEDKLKFILSDQFYNSTDWKKIREQALSRFVRICVSCGSTDNLAVDHIYPRSRFPEKALELSNTQILCLRCNSSKGNRLTIKNR